MANFCHIGIIDLVVTNQARQNRQPRSVRRSPSVGAAIVRVHIEEGTRAGEPFPLPAIVVDVEKLVQVVAVPIHNQQMTVLAAAPIEVSWIATLDPIWLCDCLWRDRIEREAGISRVINAITLASVGKLHGAKVTTGNV